MKRLKNGYMFFITLMLFLYLTFIRSFWFGLGSWDLNRSIGWGGDGDLGFILIMILSNELLYFAIGYGIVFLLRRELSFHLSMIHLFCIVISWILPKFYLDSYLTTWPVFASWVLFLLNVFTSKKGLPRNNSNHADILDVE